MEGKKVLKIFGLVLGGLIIIMIAWATVAGVFLKSAQKSLTDNMSFNDMEMAAESFSAPSVSRKDMAAGVSGQAMAPSADIAPSPAPAVEKKIIKTGNLSLKVEKTEIAAESIGNIAKLHGGEIYSSNFSESTRGLKSGYLTVRVPSANFEKTFTALKVVATQVINEATNAQDITEQYIDLEARLKNKQAEEQSFVKLLDRSGKMEDVLAVTRELARVRGEIEQLAGQKRYYDSQTDMSTITVYLSEDAAVTPVAEDWRPWQVVKNSLRELFDKGQDLIDGLIRFVIVGLPILLIYLVIIWIFYRVGRRIYGHYKSSGK